jgi:aspartate ammonia-lyase
MANTRTESDLLGSVAVPADALFGAHTQRALQNFPTAGAKTLRDYPFLIRGLLDVKKAAAQVNKKLG